MDAARKFVQARTDLLWDQPFFATLALRLPPIPDPSVKTMCTDGRAIRYNPDYVDTLSVHEVAAVVCHEVMHAANGHTWRRDSREPRKFNTACDYSINPVIRAAGMTLPEGGVDDRYAGLSAEEIYSRLPELSEDGKGGGDTPGCGEVEDSTGDDVDQLEVEWEVAVLQAATAAHQQGKLPAGLERLVDSIANPPQDWKALLRRFVQMTATDDYAWTRPNKRYVARGLYLPSLRSEAMPAILVAVDTSGSIDNATLNAFAAEIADIADECKPERVHVAYCDAAVHRVDTFECGDEVTITAVGGGGTDFRPVFDLPEIEDVACVVYLTDLCGAFPEHVDVPVLWAATTNYDPPFGDVVRIKVSQGD